MLNANSLSCLYSYACVFRSPAYSTLLLLCRVSPCVTPDEASTYPLGGQSGATINGTTTDTHKVSLYSTTVVVFCPVNGTECDTWYCILRICYSYSYIIHLPLVSPSFHLFSVLCWYDAQCKQIGMQYFLLCTAVSPSVGHVSHRMHAVRVQKSNTQRAQKQQKHQARNGACLLNYMKVHRPRKRYSKRVR